MRRIVTRVFVIAALLAAGFLGGIYYALLSADRRRAAAEASCEDWAYPGATVVQAMTAPPIKGSLFPVGRTRAVLLTTPDDVPTVAGHYLKKLGMQPEAGKGYTGSWSYGPSFGGDRPEGPASMAYLAQGLLPTGNNPDRPAQVQSFAVKTPAYTVTVVASRADGEDRTHVLLLYCPLP